MTEKARSCLLNIDIVDVIIISLPFSNLQRQNCAIVVAAAFVDDGPVLVVVVLFNLSYWCIPDLYRLYHGRTGCP